MRISISERVILVTGASSGIGAHLAGFLVAEGARVVAGARRVDAMQDLPGVGEGRCLPVRLDVADPDSAGEAVAAAVEAFGGLDGLVNNAGAAWGGRALDMPAAEWDRVVATNLSGAFHVAQAAARTMAAGRGGAIVSIASILGLGTGQGVAAYAAAKAGLVHLTRALALEWARHGIRANALAPGYVPTAMNAATLEGPEGERLRKAIPMRRLGRVEDLEGPLAFLLSDAAAYVTGAVLPVDGGHLCRPL